ncbi:probable Ammonium transporter MEP2 [Saccharomycodes ludwigii]|uniref:Ammonium transporter n=1 Tax=Saccharomycodes ludwigii TaxID=36035 RepID=A0A376B1R2_9ASCO|nr:hypothetical protein SCDLUD_002963 [Saccharomycodes ludwigii]KAH3901468.1 hypothetical protein SCDLUD_002963 [Saccharomycodes ludwigii]SSD58591.1 probable Ammonium transporter MEP2 [Saccharomycodes ludwigii]
MSVNLTGIPTGYGTGGNSLTTDLNSQYDKADMVWIAVSSCLVWLMVPGIGLLYSGLARKKHALSLLWASLMACCVVSFQWYWWGYSLAFAHNVRGKGFIGTLEFFGFKNVLGAPSSVSSLPDILFSFYQMMFAIVTGMLMVGGACERARLFPMMVFLFLWITIVYCPIACWTWNANGWLVVLGSIDYAGGTVVHISSAHAALIYALILGKRNDPLTKKGVPKYKPHSVTSVVLGTVFIWFAWFGFNGGSAGNATIRAWYSLVNTNLCAAVSGITWMIVDWFRCGRKWTTVGICCGVVTGLVVITPMAGFVPLWAAVIGGVVGAIACNFAVDLKQVLGIDDGLDVWAMHGVGGSIGNVLTGIFAADYINMTAGDESSPIPGGWINHHYKQVGYQLASLCAVIAWDCTITAILLLTMDRIPFLKLRLSPEEEEIGTDAAQIGEFTYEDASYIPEPVRSKSVMEMPEPHNAIDDQIDGSSVNGASTSDGGAQRDTASNEKQEKGDIDDEDIKPVVN